jgi:hypothetical protein
VISPTRVLTATAGAGPWNVRVLADWPAIRMELRFRSTGAAGGQEPD